MRLGGDLGEHLVVVQQDAGEGADGHAGQRAVVGPAAAAQPQAAGGDGEAGDEDDVGGRDRVDAEGLTERLEQAAAGGAREAGPR